MVRRHVLGLPLAKGGQPAQRTSAVPDLRSVGSEDIVKKKCHRWPPTGVHSTIIKDGMANERPLKLVAYMG